jgi:hypothetical protein
MRPAQASAPRSGGGRLRPLLVHVVRESACGDDEDVACRVLDQGLVRSRGRVVPQVGRHSVPHNGHLCPVVLKGHVPNKAGLYHSPALLRSAI